MNKTFEKVEWVDETTGLVCIAVDHYGHWNGYVVVPPNHVMHGKAYYECIKTPQCPNPDSKFWHCQHTPEDILEVHGGITFAGVLDFLQEDGDTRWLLGFDTAHGEDLPMFGGVSKSLQYVQAECKKLAEQLV